MLLAGDHTILEAFREGKRAVLARVYRAYSPEVVRYLSRRFAVSPPRGESHTTMALLDLEAAHQETFIRAFHPVMRQAYDGVRPYLGLLLTLARSTAIDLLRASGRLAHEAVPLEDAIEIEQLPMEERNPEERMLESEMRTLVRQFLAALPEETRALAQLRFVEGLSQESSALRLRLTRCEVRVRERHLRTQLQKYLRGQGWLETSAPRPRKGAGALCVTTRSSP